MTKAKYIGLFALIIIPIIAIIFILFYSQSSPLYESITVEAGSTGVNVSRFVKNAATDAAFITDISAIDFSTPGEYEVEIDIGGNTYTSELVVVDTTAPYAQGVDQFITTDETLTIWDFLSNLYDATEVTASYQTEPTFGVCGTTRIVINLSDTSGNTTVLSCSLTVSKLIKGITLEAGSPLPDAREFLSVDATDVEYVTDMQTVKTNTVKDYDIVISVDGEEFTSTLSVKDTVAPTATPVNAVISTTHLLSSNQLVTDIIDETSVQVYSYDDRPYGKVGVYTITLTLRDEGDNTTDYPVTVTITNDENLITLRDE